MDQTQIAATTGSIPIVVDDAQPTNLKKVLHLVNGEHFSGAERVQSHLARCLPEFGFIADFACLVPDRFPEQFDVDISQLFDLKMKNRYDLGTVFRVNAMVRKEGYELLHAHTPRSAMIASIVSKMKGIPWVYHVHSPTAHDSTRQLQNKINHWVESMSLRNVAHQITVSQSLYDATMHRGFSSFDVSVVRNGVPGENHPRVSQPEIGGDWTIGMIALHRPRKGLEVLLEALKITADSGLDITLRCVGPFETKSYEAEIHSLVRKLDLQDRMEFVGFVEDIPQLLSRLDAMVLPSLFGEGLPMVVLEAMAAGVPVIATKVEGTPEAIRHGKEGLLAEPGCFASLADQICALLSGEYDWQELSQNASHRHAEEFSDRAMARGVAEVYRKVLAKHGRLSEKSSRANAFQAAH